jgi:hypothetical protein
MLSIVVNVSRVAMLNVRMVRTKRRIVASLSHTKIEIVGIEQAGVELLRCRVATLREVYSETVVATAGMIKRFQQKTARKGTMG